MQSTMKTRRPSRIFLALILLSLMVTIVGAIRVQSPIPQLQVRRCGYLRYKIPADTFIDVIDGDTRNIKLSLKNSTFGDLSLNDWVAFDAENQTLYAALNDQILKTAAVPSNYYYQLVGTTKRGETAFATVQLVLVEKWENTSAALLISFVWVKEYKPPLAMIQSLFADKFMAYLQGPVNLIRFTHIMQASLGYSIGIANCTHPLEKCNHKGLRGVQSALYTDVGTVPAFRFSMLPEIYVSYIQVILAAECQPREGPRVTKAFPPVTILPCTRVYHPVPYDVFYDEVDGYNLQLAIYAIDGKVQNDETRWLNINGGENALYGVVTDQVIAEQPADGYNVTVRAYDSQYLWAETFLILKIAKKQLQKYYQFTLHLSKTGNVLHPAHVEQNSLVYLVNTYFKANFTNIISYKKSGAKDLTIRCSICTLPLKCDNASFYKIFDRMAIHEKPTAAFSSALGTAYSLKSVVPHIDPICLQAMEPPVPAINPWIVSITRCGGFQVKIPADLFYDRQDGDLRSLYLNLFTHNDREIPTSSWLQLNSTNQVLYGMPTQEDIAAYQSSSHQYYKLVATDRSGLNGSLQLKFSIQTSEASTYTYQIVYRQSRFSNYLVEISTFTRRLRNYLDHTKHGSIGIVKVSNPNSNTRRLYYTNCSSSFDPCDPGLAHQINSRLFVPSLNSEFKGAMSPDFSLLYATVENKTNCHLNTPPRVLRPISTIRVSVCSVLRFPIPVNSFYDKEDGRTPNLTLSLRDGRNNSLSQGAWVVWNKEEQVITFVGSVANARTDERASYLLTASDKRGLSTHTTIYTSMSGPLNVLDDCKIQTKFIIDQSLSGKSDAFLTEMILSRMTIYFSHDSTTDIGLVSVQRQSATAIVISWSVCSKRYIHYTQSSTVYQSTKNPPDYQGLSYVLRKIFVPGSFHVYSEFKSAFQGFTVSSVVKIFSGACSSFPPVIGLNRSRVTFNVSNCGITKIQVGQAWFYDLEDGDAHKLNLQFLTSLHAEITDAESWIGFDKGSKTILIAIGDKERKEKLKSGNFYLRATDSTGKFTELSITINVAQDPLPQPPYHLTYYLVNKEKRHYLKDASFIADKIAQVFNLAGGAEIMIHSFHEDKGYVDSFMFVWSSCKQPTCSSAILSKARQQKGPTAPFNTVKQLLLPRFDLQRADLMHTCGGVSTPPERQITSINFHVSMCGVSVYQMAPSTFNDAVDGNTKHLRVNFLNGQKNNVTASSWIHLNAATLQLYAIPSYQLNLHSKMLQFYLQGVNSGSLSSEVLVNVDVREEPFTNDCPIIMIIKRKFGTDHVVDLSVLHTLLKMISSYYHDQQIKIKVLKFEKLSTYWYSLKYSNCSFTFATKAEARKGYHESFRQIINQVFYKLIKPDGTVQSAFSSYVSSMFDVTSVRISYECIEAPPYPTVLVAHRSYAATCREFRDMHSKNMFNDARDGTNLNYSMTYRSGRALPPDEWVTFDSKSIEVYGMVTESVKRYSPFYGYNYLIVATDSSGRSANISYVIKIATPLPYTPVTITMAYSSKLSDRTRTADFLVNMSRKIAGYLDGASRANDIMIKSQNAGKSITFSHCKLSCTESDFLKIATKLQALPYTPRPSNHFVTAMQSSFTPQEIYIDRSKCLLKTTIETIVLRIVVINRPQVCGFIEYKIPTDVFTDNSGRSTKDFILDMYQYGQKISSVNSIFLFDKGQQLFYGPVVTSKLSRSMIYDLEAKHPESGFTGSTSFTLNMPDYDTFVTSSKSLCVVSAVVATAINPDFSDAFLVQKFMNNTAKYLDLTSEEIQIVSYKRERNYAVQLSVSFANCRWYSLISENSTVEMISKYTTSRDDTMKKIFINIQQSTAYTQTFSSALNPDFTLQSVSANHWCTKQPNKPPVANTTVITITVSPCTGFFRQIPETSFSDEDGNARSLKLQLYKQDGSSLTASDWISFNAATQTVYGSATKHVHETNNGVHKFTLKATDRYGLSTSATVSIEVAGAAVGNESPKINMNNFKITLPQCGIYRANLPEGFATDKEDGTMRNLHVAMTMVDGNRIPRDSWIQFDNKTYEIYSLPPRQTTSGSTVQRQYKVKVSDSCGGVATTTISIVTQKSVHPYYSHVFKFQSMLGKSVSYLDIETRFLQLISGYLSENSSTFKAVSFTKVSGIETYEFHFANCSTKEYVCPIVNSHYVTMQRIFRESVNRRNSLATYISSSFNITSYTNKTAYIMESPPRNTSSASTAIEVSSCGGYYHDVSQYFSHRKSIRYGITQPNGDRIPLNYPMILASNKVEVVPLGAASSDVYTVRVTAFDICNQTSYRDLQIKINVPSKPIGYQMKFESEIEAGLSTAYYASQLQTALKSHLNNPNYGIEIESYARVQKKLTLSFRSCYERKERCNKTDIRYLHSHLFTSANHTNPAFLSRLTGPFKKAKLIEYHHHCNFTSYELPTSNGSLEVVVDLCRKFEFRIPVTAFNDAEDGNARNMHLSLRTKDNKQLSYNHWLQFNRVTQAIYGYPRLASSSSFQRKYEYTLNANDIQGNSASTPVHVQIRGSTDITYKMTMQGRIKVDDHVPNIDWEILLLRKIGKFFNDYYINDVSFTRQGKSFVFSWSFCKMTTSKCDCFYIRNVERLLTKMTRFRETMNPEFELINVTSTRYGVCIHPNPPQLLRDVKDIYVYGGQSFSYFIQDNHFYDLEDGYTSNLTLRVEDDDSSTVTSTSQWIQVDKQHICGLVTLSELRSSTWATSSTSTKRLVASDACGKSTYDSFSVVMNSYRASLSYTFKVYVSETYENIRSNCTKLQHFSYLVSSYVNASTSDLFIESIYINSTVSNETFGQNNYTVIVWGLRNFTEKNCQNETIRSYREKFTYENGTVNGGFYNYMKSDFNVVKVDENTTACSNGTIVPIIVPVKPDADFPLWVLILLLILAILFLLCWCCWICIPRCCANCCTGCIYRYCGCCSLLCGKCCVPGGKYASLDEVAQAPDVEDGVLSSARTTPESSSDSFGKQAIPDDVEAATPVDEIKAPPKIDEEEMKMDENGAPMLYAAPDYLTTEQATSNDIDNDIQSDEPDNSDMAAAAAPLPDDVTKGVAAMPREESQDTETNALSQFDDYSSGTSSKNEIDESALAAPISSDIYDYEQGSYSESSYSRQETVLELPETTNVMPVSQAALAPSLEEKQASAKKLSLPQTPNIFMGHDSMAGNESAQSVMTESRNASERRTSNESTMYSSEGRRMSVTKPMRLILPRQSVTSLAGIDVRVVNDDVIPSQRAERRRSSQMILMDHDELGDAMSNQERRASQGRRESQIFIKHGGNSQGQTRRLSRVRIMSSDGSFVDNEPIELKIMTSSSQPRGLGESGETRLVSKRSSVVSNSGFGYSEGGRRSVDDFDAYRRMGRSSMLSQAMPTPGYQSDRKTSRDQRTSISSRQIASSDFADAASGRKTSNARRVSLSTRRESVAEQQPFALFDESGRNEDEYFTSRNSRQQLLGYESDSTDSGYAISRRSKRYRRNSRHSTSGDIRDGAGLGEDFHSGDDGYDNRAVQIRKKSVTKLLDVGKTQGYESPRFELGDSHEGWSKERKKGRGDLGYANDSFV